MSVRRVLLVCLVVVGSAACARGPDEVRVLGSSEGRAGAVSGVVRRLGAPVAGAVVQVAGRSAVADASGAYRVDGVQPGSHRLEARDPGDDSVACSASGACTSGRSAAEVAVTVVVPPEGGDVRADVEL